MRFYKRFLEFSYAKNYGSPLVAIFFGTMDCYDNNKNKNINKTLFIQDKKMSVFVIKNKGINWFNR